MNTLRGVNSDEEIWRGFVVEVALKQSLEECAGFGKVGRFVINPAGAEQWTCDSVRCVQGTARGEMLLE